MLHIAQYRITCIFTLIMEITREKLKGQDEKLNPPLEFYFLTPSSLHSPFIFKSRVHH